MRPYFSMWLLIHSITDLRQA
ncbi:hypothetical protein Gotri_000018 [Gossypium trilobum]|uniref:Uncharacterized protein n=1 Tax=Gossypium trilobum TaxID=34281 RepID=A0A7J9FL01_9ROSI|nr:hypothetical protein [Gossypium trilobum]